jgi:two-component system sensor histidine kinase VicK
LEAANERVLQFWGKTPAIIGLPLARALPELQGQSFLQLLDNVFVTGEPYYGNEALSLLEHNGELKAGYFNFIYQPVKNEQGAVTSITMVATDVTEQVKARKEVEKAEEKTRFAIEAANVGTWFLDVETREFIVSPRLKEQFGYYADMVAAAIPDEYREKVTRGVEKAIATGRNYIMEHPVIGHHDQKKRWVRAYGKLYPNDSGKLSHFSGLIIDVTEQKQDEMRKSDFIGMVSHELKTPLTSLSAYAQMLYSKARNNDDGFTLSALEKVNIQVKKMSAMINGFLNVSRLESGKIFLSKHDFELSELVGEMISDAKLTMGSHTITFTHSEPIMVNADIDKVGSVISNLLSNAVKYSPRGERIEVECRLVNNAAQVSVKDEGIGIKPQDIDKIFDRYYRVESSHTKTVSGFGIGLYLCAEIVQRHDGKIWVESEKAKGSTFYFSLPVN